MSQEVVCVVARQRSGTTALRANLGATGRFRDFGEIFHSTELEGVGSYFRYCRDNNILVSDVTTPDSILLHCTEYMNHLRKAANNKHVLIDVKFNSCGTIRPAWRYIHEEPYFFQFLKKLGAIFIFIRREDIADQIISSQIAKVHGQWQNLVVDDTADKIEVNINRAVREARMIRQSELFLWKSLKSYRKCRHYVYEELFASGHVSDVFQHDISELLGEELVFPRNSPIRKSEVDKALNVKNYEEVRLAIQGVMPNAARPTKS